MHLFKRKFLYQIIVLNFMGYFYMNPKLESWIVHGIVQLTNLFGFLKQIIHRRERCLQPLRAEFRARRLGVHKEIPLVKVISAGA